MVEREEKGAKKGQGDLFSKIQKDTSSCIIVLNHHAKFEENR